MKFLCFLRKNLILRGIFMEIDNIGERFRALRTRLNLSQKDFSKETGISQSVIADIERGAKDPSRAVLLAIAQRYHVSLDWLLLGIEPSKETGEIEKMRLEIETLKKENSVLEEDIRKIQKECKKLDTENREISKELMDRLRQLVYLQNKVSGTIPI
jgi:transcriptional regulator with XRE-family HTH domain